MKVKVQSGDIASFAADAIVVNLFEGVTSPGGGTGAVDQAMGGAISELIAAGDIRGKPGEFTLVHTLGKLPSPRVVVAGLGKQASFNVDKIRDLSGDLARYLRRQRVKNGAADHATAPASAGSTRRTAPRRSPRARCSGSTASLRHKKAEDDGRPRER